MICLSGNILEEVKSGVILQQVNAQGVMGSGIAKAIRDKWPAVWDVYSLIIRPGSADRGKGHLGRVLTIEVEPDLFVASIVGQQFYGKDGKKYTSYDALDTGFKEVARINKKHPLPIHHPLLGSGLGGGDWGVVASLIQANLGETTLWTLPEP